MTSAPVTAPAVSREDRRREAVAQVFYSTRNLTRGGHPTGDDYAQAERFLKTLAERGDTAGSEIPGGLLRSAVDRADQMHRDAMLRLHDWDKGIFGGYFCTTCTPEDPATADDIVSFPCPPLRDAGVTDAIAADLIRAHYAEQAEKVREAQKAGLAPLPKLDGFRDYDSINVGYVGDHGDMVALGWHHNHRHVLHAFDCLARDQAGIAGVYDDPDRAPGKHNLTRTWALNTGHGTGEDQWRLTWSSEVNADTPYAFPVTLLVM